MHRIRLVTQHYTRADEGGWLPVAGTITMCDLQRSPRWFTKHPRPRPTDDTRTSCRQAGNPTDERRSGLAL